MHPLTHNVTAIPIPPPPPPPHPQKPLKGKPTHPHLREHGGEAARCRGSPGEARGVTALISDRYSSPHLTYLRARPRNAPHAYPRDTTKLRVTKGGVTGGALRDTERVTTDATHHTQALNDVLP